MPGVLYARVAGAWVPISGGSSGTNEVEVGTSDPIGTNPAAEIWYDTDAVPTDPAPVPWNALTFASGWSNLGSGYQPAGYRKIGDVVYVRGVVQAAAGAGTTIATLPVGFRPLSTLVLATWYATPQAATRLLVTSSGTINADLLAAPIAHITTDFSFSVTA